MSGLALALLLSTATATTSPRTIAPCRAGVSALECRTFRELQRTIGDLEAARVEIRRLEAKLAARSPEVLAASVVAPEPRSGIRPWAIAVLGGGLGAGSAVVVLVVEGERPPLPAVAIAAAVGVIVGIVLQASLAE